VRLPSRSSLVDDDIVSRFTFEAFGSSLQAAVLNNEDGGKGISSSVLFGRPIEVGSYYKTDLVME